MTDRESDPFHDDNLTQEEFEAAMNANFPQITIPDPVAVGKWLDEQTGEPWHTPSYGTQGWSCLHWDGVTHQHARGPTHQYLLGEINRLLAENDPIAKLRKEWEAMGKPDLNDPAQAPSANQP